MTEGVPEVAGVFGCFLCVAEYGMCLEILGRRCVGRLRLLCGGLQLLLFVASRSDPTDGANCRSIKAKQ